MSMAMLRRKIYSGVPSILLGVLLNTLDAVSTGLLVFPSAKGGKAFDGLQVQGMSLYIMSTIISQLALSLGGSRFSGGLGSMLIEILPFLRAIAKRIRDALGDDDPALMPTIMVAYALCSIVLGTAFLVLGMFRCGRLVEYIPRTVLSGVIGAIGVSLFELGLSLATPSSEEPFRPGLLITTRQFNVHSSLFLASFLPALFLSITTRSHLISELSRGATQHALYVPVYMLSIGIIFWIVIASRGFATKQGMDYLAQLGWLFTLDDSVTRERGLGTAWMYWRMFDLTKVSWWAIGRTMPTMALLVIISLMVLSVFVPSLAMALRVQTYSMDHEFIGHAVSNLLAGLAGTVPNLVVFSNAYFFTRAGGGRIEALVVTAFTMVLFLTSALILPYTPTILASALVLFLGIELLVESVWETSKTSQWSEWSVIVGTLFSCTYLGFTPGFMAGLALSILLHFGWGIADSQFRVKELHISGQDFIPSHGRPTPRSMGELSIALQQQRDTENRAGLRKPPNMKFVGLTGYMFFSSIPPLEKECDKHFASLASSSSPCSFIVLDLTSVHRVETGVVEYLARKTQEGGSHVKPVIMALCGLNEGSGTYQDFKRGELGLVWPGDNPSLFTSGRHFICFDDRRVALRWCNAYLSYLSSFRHGSRCSPESLLQVADHVISDTNILEQFSQLCSVDGSLDIFSMLPGPPEETFSSIRPVEYASQLGVKVKRYLPGDILAIRGDHVERATFIVRGQLSLENIVYLKNEEQTWRPSLRQGASQAPHRLLSRGHSLFVRQREFFDDSDRGMALPPQQGQPNRVRILVRGDHLGLFHYLVGGKQWEDCDRIAVTESGPCWTVELSMAAVPEYKQSQISAWLALVAGALDQIKEQELRWLTH